MYVCVYVCVCVCVCVFDQKLLKCGGSYVETSIRRQYARYDAIKNKPFLYTFVSDKLNAAAVTMLHLAALVKQEN